MRNSTPRLARIQSRLSMRQWLFIMPREPMNKSSGIALSRKWLRFGVRLRRSYVIYEAKHSFGKPGAEDEPFLLPTLRALSWRAVCVAQLANKPLAKGTTLGFTTTPSIPSRQDGARLRGLVQRFPSVAAEKERF